MGIVAPIRLSVDPEDKGYGPLAFNANVRVTLNGIPQKYVVTFDRREGWVDRYQADENGKCVVRGDDLVVERVRGVVSAWIEE